MASNSKLTASFILKLEDQLSGGLTKLQAALDKIFAIAKKLSFPGLEGATDKIDKVTQASGKLTGALVTVTNTGQQATHQIQAVGRAAESAAFKFGQLVGRGREWAATKIGNASARIGVIGGAVAGYGVIAPIRPYAAQENTLRHIAITQKLSGPAVEAEVARLTANLNHEALATGQSSHELAKAYNFLITTGMSAHQVDTLMPAHAQAATAYNISSDSMGQAVFALADTFKISHEDMAPALAAMAYAAKEGHFNVESFSHFLPTVSGSMSKMGMHGRGAADTAFAALETVVKNAADPGTAATNFKDLLDYIVSPMSTRSFAHAGIDMPAILRDAEKHGVDPLTAYLGKLQQMTKGMTPIEQSLALSKVLHNEQARDAALALLQHPDQFLDLRAKLGAVDRKTIDTDFASAFRAPEVQLRILTEQFDQLIRRVGEGFAPAVRVANVVMLAMVHGFEWLDQHMPGVADKLLIATAGLLAVVAALGVLGVAAPAVAAGFSLIVAVLGAIFSPATAVIAVIALLAAAAYDIYDNWGTFAPFFGEMWEGVKKLFGGFLRFLAGAFNFDMTSAIAGLTDMWDGLKQYYFGLWAIIVRLFNDFTGFVDRWTGGAMSAGIASIKKEWDGLKAYFFDLWASIRAPFDQFISDFENSSVGRMMGLSTAPTDMTGATDGRKGDETYALPKRDTSGGTLDIRFTNLPPGTAVTSSDRDRFRPLLPLGSNVGIP
jgi:TP901 family phage tail tape measure protein